LSTPRRPGGEEPKRPQKKRRRLRWLSYAILIMLGLFLGGIGLTGAVVLKAYRTLPAYEEFDPSLTSVIYDAKGRKVYELADEENRTLVKLSDVSKDIQQALIDTEDTRFRDHFGVDIWRVGGAVWADIKYYLGVKGSQLEGASTITMQLTKQTFLTADQNMMRKIQEALIAVQLERRFTKEEILEKYLNQVSFGRQASGIEAAAQTYFSKHAKELTLSEGALLVGILKATSQYDPIVNYEGAINRRAVVLDQMVKYGHLTADRAAQLKDEKPKLNPAKITPTSVTFTGDWYVDYVISVLTDNPSGSATKYGTPVFDARDLYHKGLQIYTYLDLDYQKVADAKVKELMPIATKEYKSTNVPQAAVVILNHQTGEVKALTGGLEHKQMLGYNRAVQAYRQPGSTIKPLVSYLPAIDLLGWGPASVIDDSPPQLTYPDKRNVWPENYEFRFSGLQNMRYGVEQSINAMAVRTLMAVTPSKGIQYARKLGLSTIVDAAMNPQQNDENLALALGGLTVGVTPLELTSAYGTLGNLGMRVEPTIIKEIRNKSGEVIFRSQPSKQQVIAKESTWLMVDVMKGSVLRGTASYEAKGWHGWPAAGKTGTTENWHDAWFVGFTPELVTGIWTGYDNNDGKRIELPGSPGFRWTGAGPPTRIWTAIMDELVKEKPADWVRPPGVVQVEVCKTSGMLPSPLCPKTDIITDWFRAAKVPNDADNVWSMARVVKQPMLNPQTNQPILDSVTKKPVSKYFLWKDGCGSPEDLLLLKRPTTYVRHPSDPWNFGRYWPADWWRELPTEVCTPVSSPPPTTTPPTTTPPTTTPPITPPVTPPVTPPPGGITPPVLPPVIKP